MRSEQEMMGLIQSSAAADERIRIATLEGSRTNIHIPKDDFQDYDVTFFVTDMESFTSHDGWLAQFGNRILLQKPEDMELFPAEEKGFSYLMLFDDYTKMDLTLLPLGELEDYLNGDQLVQVLLDKDNRIGRELVPSDSQYHVQQPTCRQFDDCCNEFWNVTTYVVKGLCRRELLFAIDHLNQILRPELLRMLAWKVGFETGFSLSLGKNNKIISCYLPTAAWEDLLTTYRMDGYPQVWEVLFVCHRLFLETALDVVERLGCTYPDYDSNITRYTEDMFARYGVPEQEEEYGADPI